MRTILSIMAFLLFTPAASAEPICINVAIGQSNAGGFGEIAESPPVPVGGVYRFDGTTLVTGTDDSGAGGSIWPAFNTAFYLHSNMKSLWFFSPGSFMTDVTAANVTLPLVSFGANGAGVPQTFDMIDNASTAAIAAGFVPRLCMVVIVQGESEGKHIAIFPGIVDAPDWISEAKNLQRRFRERHGEKLLFVIIRLGTTTGTISNYEAGFAIIRQAQEYMAETDSRTIIGSRAAYFCAAAYGMLEDIHYTQKCNNLLGTQAGTAAAVSGLWK